MAVAAHSMVYFTMKRKKSKSELLQERVAQRV